MTEVLESLIAALREELTHYGEMLALLDQQQESAIHRHSDEMLAATTAIQNHASIIQTARREREDRQRSLARELSVAEASTFIELCPLLPAHYRPLVQSLVDENNALVQRVQQHAHQNHQALSRSVKLMQRLLGMLFPAREGQGHNGPGSRKLPALPSPPLYEALS